MRIFLVFVDSQIRTELLSPHHQSEYGLQRYLNKNSCGSGISSFKNDSADEFFIKVRTFFAKARICSLSHPRTTKTGVYVLRWFIDQFIAVV